MSEQTELALEKLEKAIGGRAEAAAEAPCPLCGKKFSAYDELENHLRSHPEFVDQLEDVIKIIRRFIQIGKDVEKELAD